ncbi:uncharacterized protein LOC141581120 [Saimiri boliviensis]|uniref:uncharacterized protein LOC141581120 n=1 Tax=Saimiri boliviensis TaxID=27679 RepID=UPI003D788256
MANSDKAKGSHLFSLPKTVPPRPEAKNELRDIVKNLKAQALESPVTALLEFWPLKEAYGCDNRLLKYQALVLEGPVLQLCTRAALNPAAFLPKEGVNTEHDCQQVLALNYAALEDLFFFFFFFETEFRSCYPGWSAMARSRLTATSASWVQAGEDLLTTPLANPDLNLYTDGSSFMENGVQKARYAIVSDQTVLESNSLLPGTSAQLAELGALTQALKLGRRKRINVYTDFRHAHLVLHAWKERGFLTSAGTPIKYHNENVDLLQAIQEPEEVAVLHCRGHQKEDEKKAEGNG